MAQIDLKETELEDVDWIHQAVGTVSGELLEMQETFGFHKRRGISGLRKQLAAFSWS
jgi:hypothetical protein